VAGKRLNSRIKVDIQGIDELHKKVKSLNKNVCSVLGGIVKEGADIVRDDAKTRARRKSGALASGIVSMITWDKGGAPVAFAGAGMDKNMNDTFVKYSANGKRYYYPSSIEYGHAGAPAYPFMRPALQKNRAKIRKLIAEKMKQVIGGAGR
jgi:HK97 gp10 family phage protein